MISLSLLNLCFKERSNFSYHSHIIHMTVSVFVSKLSGMPGAIHSQFYLAMRNAENIQTIEYSVHQTQFLTNFLAFNTQLRLYLNYISSCRLSWIVIGYITLLSTIRIQVFNPHIFAYWFSRWLNQWFILLYVGGWWNKTEITNIESVLSYVWTHCDHFLLNELKSLR